MVDGAVDELQQGDLPGLHQGLAPAHGFSSSIGTAKLYGAQGPLYSHRTPSRPSTQERTSARKVSALARCTRKADRRSSISPWASGVERAGGVTRPAPPRGRSPR